MEKNVGSSDKAIRLIVGAVLLIVAFTATVSAVVKTILVVAAVIAIGTALVNFCPLYKVTGINTGKPAS